MEDRIKVLYISYDGMTDPLGQSQVIPYLIELAKQNIEIHILSAEKKEVFTKRHKYISQLLNDSGINWHPVFYTKKPPIISTIKDVFVLRNKAKFFHNKYNFNIVHCRSYIAAFAGIFLKRKFGVKFLFDMRGFYADERIDGGLWPQSNPIYKMVYRYFKKKEKLFFSQADYTVSLTYAGKDIIHNKFNFLKIPIEVIPCCADLSHFDFNKTNKSELEKLRNEMGIIESDFVLSYLGSVGTWYMPEEMLLFFKSLKVSRENAKFLFITRDNPTELLSLASKIGINTSDLIIRPADREEVPLLIALSQASLFFIKPVFSKKASSPTKLAELLGMGVPVICNSNVGDIDKFVPENNLGILISELNQTGFEQAITQIDKILKIDSVHLRSIAQELFSLQTGSERYLKIYKTLCSK
jgi:glycosyltransferase involved in cell wall biosynthesis